MFEQHSQLKERALAHLDKIAAFARARGRDTIARQIEEGRRHLAENRYNIAIVGDIKRGKSTLLNTLLGRADDDLSPVRAKVCTSAIVHYLSQEAHPEGQAEVRVYFDSSLEPVGIPYPSLREYITEDGNPGNAKGVRSVDVYGNFPLLHNVVTLVDTPGKGAIHRHHEILLDRFIPLADAIIFLIEADLPVTASESEFLAQLGKQEKERIFFVLTKRDEIEDKDISEVRAYVIRKIAEAGLDCQRLFEISAKPVFEAVKSGEDAGVIQRLRQQHGLAELETELERFIINTSAKNAALFPRLQALHELADRFCHESRAEVDNDLDLLSQGRESIIEEIRKLEQGAEELRVSSEKTLRKFQSNWTKSVESFCRKLEGRADAISDRILNKVRRGGIVNLAINSFKTQRFVEGCIAAELEALMPDLDQRLADHVTALSLEIEGEWNTHIRPRVQTDWTMPLASGIGLAGTISVAGLGVSQSIAAVAAWAGVAGASATQGAAAGLWAWLAGGGSVAFATQAAIAATGPAVISIAGAFAAGWIAKQAILSAQDVKIPTLVANAVEEMTGRIRAGMNRSSTEITSDFRSSIEERIQSNQERLETLEKAISKADPSRQEDLSRFREECRALLVDGEDLGKSIKLQSRELAFHG